MDKSGPIKFKQFYMRRSLRLFPAFYAVWGLCILTLRTFPEQWATFFYMGDYYLALTAAYGPWFGPLCWEMFISPAGVFNSCPK